MGVAALAEVVVAIGVEVIKERHKKEQNKRLSLIQVY